MPVRQLTCRYKLHELPLCPCSLKSSNVSEEAGLLLDRDTSPSVSEVLGLGCVKPVMFTLPLGSSIITPAVIASLKCKVVQIGPQACQEHNYKRGPLAMVLQLYQCRLFGPHQGADKPVPH